MKIRKVRRKCSVRGCRCTESYALSLSNEFGNSIIACKKCILEAAEAVKNYKEDLKPVKRVRREPPALFFNAKAMGAKENALPESEPLVIEDKETAENLVEALEESMANAEEKEPAETPPKTSVKKKKGAQGK